MSATLKLSEVSEAVKIHQIAVICLIESHERVLGRIVIDDIWRPIEPK